MIAFVFINPKGQYLHRLDLKPKIQMLPGSSRSNLVGLDLCSEYHKTEVRVSARLGEIHSKLTWVGRTQFPGTCGAEAHAPLLAASQGRSPFSLQANSGVLNPSHALNP